MPRITHIENCIFSFEGKDFNGLDAFNEHLLSEEIQPEHIAAFLQGHEPQKIASADELTKIFDNAENSGEKVNGRYSGDWLESIKHDEIVGRSSKSLKDKSNKSLSDAYLTAKENNTNPHFVKAVDEFIKAHTDEDVNMNDLLPDVAKQSQYKPSPIGNPSDFVETENAVMEGGETDKIERDNGEASKLPKKGYIVDATYLKEGKEKGKGYGQELYKKALDKYGTLYSHSDISEDAINAQNALERKGYVTIKNISVDGTDFRMIEKAEPAKKNTDKPLTSVSEVVKASPNILVVKPGSAEKSATKKAQTEESAPEEEVTQDFWPSKEQVKEANTILKSHKVEPGLSVADIYSKENAPLSDMLEATEASYGDAHDKMEEIDKRIKKLNTERKTLKTKEDKKNKDIEIQQQKELHNDLEGAVQTAQLHFQHELQDKVVARAKELGYDVTPEDLSGLNEYAIPYLTEGRMMESVYHSHSVQQLTDGLIHDYFDKNSDLHPDIQQYIQDEVARLREGIDDGGKLPFRSSNENYLLEVQRDPLNYLEGKLKMEKTFIEADNTFNPSGFSEDEIKEQKKLHKEEIKKLRALLNKFPGYNAEEFEDDEPVFKTPIEQANDFASSINSNHPFLTQWVRDNGYYIDPDMVRNEMRPFGYDGTNSHDYNMPMKVLLDNMFSGLLAKAHAEENINRVELFTGHPGAGKSTIIRNRPDIKNNNVFYDGTLSSMESLLDKIKTAGDFGMKVRVTQVYRNPFDSFGGTLERLAAGETRIVKPSYFLGAYNSMAERLKNPTFVGLVKDGTVGFTFLNEGQVTKIEDTNSLYPEITEDQLLEYAEPKAKSLGISEPTWKLITGRNYKRQADEGLGQPNTGTAGSQSSNNGNSGPRVSEKQSEPGRLVSNRLAQAGEKKLEQLASDKKAFLEALKNSRKKLNVGIDPEILIAGAKMIATYTEIGVIKFAEIATELAESLGKSIMDSDFVKALKASYAAHRANLSRTERSTFDSDDAVDDFIEQALPNILNTLPDENGNDDGSADQSDEQSGATNTDGEEPRDTETIIGEAENAIREATRPETNIKEKGKAIEQIDNLLDEVDRKLKLLGIYTNEGQKESDVTETGSKLPERKFKADLTKYSKTLAKALGYEHDTIKKGKKEVVVEIANTNIAPIGGDGHIILWKPGSKYGVYISVPVDRSDNADFDTDYSDGEQLAISTDKWTSGPILWRVTKKDSKYSGMSNRWANANISVEDFAEKIRDAVNQYAKEEIQKDVAPAPEEEKPEVPVNKKELAVNPVYEKTKNSLLNNEDFKEQILNTDDALALTHAQKMASDLYTANVMNALMTERGAIFPSKEQQSSDIKNIAQDLVNTIKNKSNVVQDETLQPGISGQRGIGTQRTDTTPVSTGESATTSQPGQQRPSDRNAESSGGQVQRPDARSNDRQTGNDGTGSQGSGVEGSNSQLGNRPGESGTTRIEKELETERTEGSENYHFNEEDEARDIRKGFPVGEHYRKNIEVLKLIKKLQVEGRRATPDEQKVLGQYVGWGGLKDVVFNPYRDTQWNTASSKQNRPYVREVYDLIKELDPEGNLNYIQSIIRSTRNAHYTSFPVIRAMWDGVIQAGFKAGKILEPAAGIGNFFAAMPESIQKNVSLTGVEMDELTATVLKYLYPLADIKNSPFEKAHLANNSYDIAISNVPFGQIKINDEEYRKHPDKRFSTATNMVHNYFFVKSMDAVRPGGMIAFITGTGTLDASSMKPVRQLLAEQGQFLGAVRLPNNAFKANAGTEVVTDIIFFRKYNENETPVVNQPFISTKEKQLPSYTDNTKNNPVSYNEYYQLHPGNMIGKAVSGDKTRFGRDESFSLVGDDDTDFRKEISDRIKSFIPKNIFTKQQLDKNKSLTQATENVISAKDFAKIGSLAVLPNGTIGRVTGNIIIDEQLDKKAEALGINPNSIRSGTITHLQEEALNRNGLSSMDWRIHEVQPVSKTWGKDNIAKLPAMIKLRDALNALLNKEFVAQEDDQEMRDMRKQLNKDYDAWVKKNGFINDASNKRLLEQESDQHVLRALEIKDSSTGQYKRSDIFQKRTINPILRIDKAENLQDAILVSLQELGRADLDRISDLLSKPQDEVIKEINSADSPLLFKQPNGNYAVREDYLSGDVKTKLAEAEQAARKDASFDRNVEELTKVIPKDIEATVNTLYSPVHARWMPTKIITDFLNDKLGVNNARVEYNGREDKFKVRTNTDVPIYGVNSDLAQRKASWIFEHAINGTEPKVTWIDADKKSHVDPKGTDLAIQLIDKIQQEWNDWKFAEKERRDLIKTIYNDLFNRTVLRSYDGSHLTLPGLANFILAQHQKDAVWRNTLTFGGVLDHKVGSGKTLVMSANAMEWRRLGISKKPMIVGLKSQIPQMHEEFKKAYPLSKVLFPSEKDFTKNNRKRLLSQIATNDWDSIILSHSQFEKLIQSPDIADEIVKDMVEYLDELIAGEDNKLKLKSLENRKEKLLVKAERLRQRQKDEDVLRFDQLGVDSLQVDESQEFKNLEYSTIHQNVKGLGTPEGSKRAFNMLIATRTLQKLHGGDKGVLFASGTPIANSLAELYLLFKCLSPSELQKRGIRNFDQWVSTFAESSTDQEYYLGKYKSVTRFRKFVNLPELITWYRTMADVRNDSNLTLRKPTGVPHLVKLEISKDQANFIDMLLKYIETKGNAFAGVLGLTKGYDSENGMNPSYGILAQGFAKKISLDVRLANKRMVGGEKIRAAADNIKKIYDDSNHFKGTQLVFSDLGTPKSANKVVNFHDYLDSIDTPLSDRTDIFGEPYVSGEKETPPAWKDIKEKAAEVLNISPEEVQSLFDESQLADTFNVYTALKNNLVENGIPEDEVQFIHSYNTRDQRIALYNAVNSGQIRVLLGSTVKMGVGVNVQERAVAAHHLDIVWKPSDLEQRNGRIERQKNIYAESHWNNKVDLYYYATERTLDASMYNLVAMKARFINQIKTGDLNVRSMDDDSDDILSGMAAELSGDPLYKESVTLQKTIKKLQNLKDAISTRRIHSEDEIHRLENRRRYATVRIAELDELNKVYQENHTIRPIDHEAIDALKTKKETYNDEWKKLHETQLQDVIKAKAAREGGTPYTKLTKEQMEAIKQKKNNLTELVKQVSDQIEELEDVNKFEGEVKGQQYTGTKNFGAAVLDALKEANKTQVIGRTFPVGKIWGMNLSGTFYSRGINEHETQLKLFNGDNVLDTWVLRSADPTGVAQGIKNKFDVLADHGWGYNKEYYKDDIENINNKLPGLQTAMQTNFEEQPKLDAALTRYNQVTDEIRKKIEEEAKRVIDEKSKNAGTEEENAGDNDEPGDESAGDVVRRFKIKYGPAAYSNILAIPVELWNASVELVAKAIDAGEALIDALQKGRDYIRRSQKDWNKPAYGSEMIAELKNRGYMQYNLTAKQQKEADKVLRNVEKGRSIRTEIRAIRDAYDDARTKMISAGATVDQLNKLESSFNELERYLFDNVSAQQFEQVANRVNLDLKPQTRISKIITNFANRYKRVEETQKAIDKAGITIEEKNDIVNRADRYRAIAEAKVNEELAKVGLAETDVFIWKGQKKIKDSLFDRMNKDGVDYRKFNLYLYALFAPERNTHVARVRQEKLTAHIEQLKADYQTAFEKASNDPSPANLGNMTRIDNLLKKFNEYNDEYNSPSGNKNYIRLIENEIPKNLRLMNDGGSGMTNQQAKEIVDEVKADTDQLGKFEKYRKEVKDLVDRSLELQRDYGLIEPEDYDYIKDYYTNYVPLKVEDSYFDDDETKSYAKSGMSGSKIFASKGADYITFEDRVNPMTQAIIRMQSVVFDGEENKYKQVIADAITSAPDPNVWEVQPARYVPQKDKNGRPVRFNELKAPDNSIPFYSGGIKQYIVVHDDALFKALSEADVKGAIPVLAKINTFFRGFATVYNPNFTISNLFRDMQTAGIVLSANEQNKLSAAFRKNRRSVLSIIRGSFKASGDMANTNAEKTYWENVAKDYTENGGNMSWFRPEAAEDMVTGIEEGYEAYKKGDKHINGAGFEAMKQVGLYAFDLFNRANNSIEQSTRLAVYDAALKTGVQKYKAVQIARNATINFNKKGNYGALIDSLYLFYNAGVQGTFNTLYTMATTKKGAMMAGGLALFGLLSSMYNNLMSDCNEGSNPGDCYDNIKDYEKSRYMLIKNPFGHGFIKIPLAYGFSWFYGIGEQIGQMINGKTSAAKASLYLLSDMLNNFNPMGNADTPALQQISPTATDPVVQWFTNKDGLGRPIYSDYDYDKRPDSQKGFKSNSELSKEFSNYLNTQTGGNDRISGKVDVSPGTIDWLTNSVFGGLGQFVMQVGTSSSLLANGKLSSIEPKDIPIAGRFYSLPKTNIDKSIIYNTLDDSYHTILSPEDKKAFDETLAKGVRLSDIDKSKADKYESTVERNQFQLTHSNVTNVLDAAKTRILEPDELGDFYSTIAEYVEDGTLPASAMNSYKSEISKDQNKLRKEAAELQ